MSVIFFSSYFIYKSYKKLVKNKIAVYSVKNDAFTIKASDIEQCKQLLDFDVGIGNWRLSKDQHIIYPLDDLKFNINNEIRIEPLHITQLDVPDEYDTEHICKLFEKA